MRFNKLALPALGLLMTSCGLLGSKNAPTQNSGDVGNTGCLNDTGALVSRYVAGQISNSEWKGAFDCVNQSLDFFTQYVRGSAQDTYSQNDMYTLVSKFLITNKPVHQALMNGAFNLKASLFGGTTTEFTKDEIELLKTSLNRLRDITADLIPYIAIRQQANPTYDQLNDMIAAFKLAGEQMADLINTLPTSMLSDSAVTSLINELVVSLNLPVIDDLSQTLFSVKWVLFNTRRDAIETTDWPLVVKDAMGLGGMIVAFKASIGDDVSSPRHDIATRLQNDYRFREFLWTVAQDAKPYLTDMVTRHNGAVPFPLFDHLLDELPADLLDNLPKEVLKQSLRPIIRRLLISSTQEGLDQGAIDTVYSLMGETVADLGLLDRFYEATGLSTLSVQPKDFSAALDRYYGSLAGADQVRFAIIKQKLMTYQPLLYQDTARIRFERGIGYNKLQQLTVLLVDRIGRHLVKTYGSGVDYFVDDDMTTFFNQYQDILFALKAVDPTISDFGPKRRSDMDLFTPASDGDGKGSIPELVNYAMMLTSSYSMTFDMQAVITPKCDVGLGQDLMGWTRLPSDCFRREFNDKLSQWITQFPRLSKFWDTLSEEDREQAMIWLEHGARRNGYTNVEFDKFDINAMATILHYTETLFDRFDGDYTEIISKSEVKNAYPIFKSMLAKKANTSVNNDYILKGIFTYIVKYRSMPQTSGITNLAKLGWWLAIYALPTTNYSTDRLGVFNITCQLALPETASQQALTQTICSKRQ